MAGFDQMERAYWERFGQMPPVYYGLDDQGMAKLLAKALERGQPLGDDDGPDLPDDADA